ncbi:hypothetical protein ACJ73_01400, partial [Blastomyces percursus]
PHCFKILFNLNILSLLRASTSQTNERSLAQLLSRPKSSKLGIREPRHWGINLDIRVLYPSPTALGTPHNILRYKMCR